MSEEPQEETAPVEVEEEDDDNRPRFKPLNVVGIVLLLLAMAFALWQAERDNQRIMEARARQEADQGGAPRMESAFPLDLNKATRRELEQLPEIGEKYAAEIVRLREERGRIESVDELLEISGIGEKTLDRIRGLVFVSPPDSAPAAEDPVDNRPDR